MSTLDLLPTPEACRYVGTSRFTLARKLKPAGLLRSGRRGRPMCLWSVRDLDRMIAKRQGGADHA